MDFEAQFSKSLDHGFTDTVHGLHFAFLRHLAGPLLWNGLVHPPADVVYQELAIGSALTV